MHFMMNQKVTLKGSKNESKVAHFQIRKIQAKDAVASPA